MKKSLLSLLLFMLLEFTGCSHIIMTNHGCDDKIKEVFNSEMRQAGKSSISYELVIHRKIYTYTKFIKKANALHSIMQDEHAESIYKQRLEGKHFIYAATRPRNKQEAVYGYSLEIFTSPTDCSVILMIRSR